MFSKEMLRFCLHINREPTPSKYLWQPTRDTQIFASDLHTDPARLHFIYIVIVLLYSQKTSPNYALSY